MPERSARKQRSIRRLLLGMDPLVTVSQMSFDALLHPNYIT